MFGIQHFLTKGDGNENEYNLFRVLEPSTEQENENNSNDVVVNQENGENKETELDVVVVVKPEITRQILVDKCGEHDWLYADWNVRGNLPSPMRLVMFRPSMCQLCGVVDDSIRHDQFYSGYVYEHMGFNYCWRKKIFLSNHYLPWKIWL